jgi:glyoxylase-like metal-dependent hydrolase (beta-lactamase superfamily II)
VAGITDEDSNLLFPNAAYMMQKDEWAFWENRENLRLMHPDFAEFDPLSFDRLPLIKEKVQFFEPEGEVLPGIQAIAAPGHTPGHSAFLILSEGQKLLHISDLVHDILHFEYPDWYTKVDINPEGTPPSRRKVFSRAVAEDLLVFGCHTPHFGLGHILPNGNTWRWQSLSIEDD